MKYFYYLIFDIFLIVAFISETQIFIINEPNNYAYLKIDDFEELFIMSKDNEYYLNHDLAGNYDIKGSLFADYRTRINDRILIIYGHNSQSLDVPFKYLENYYNEDFFHKHTIIEIYNNDIHYKYQIYSIFIATNDFFYMDLDIDYQTYINKTKELSWFHTNIDISINDDIIVLQTCSYHKKYSNYLNKYLLIIGKKIKE